uniref:Uncharacterized protein n=1 Tax=Kryptolebias marmoratus TaxID=37003 RepID=A0A3Q3AQY3_KRYMA
MDGWMDGYYIGAFEAETYIFTYLFLSCRMLNYSSCQCIVLLDAERFRLNNINFVVFFGNF